VYWLGTPPLGTEWQSLIGCLKLQVNLHKRATNYRALVQKMTYEDKASYDSTPPCRYSQILNLLEYILVGLSCENSSENHEFFF